MQVWPARRRRPVRAAGSVARAQHRRRELVERRRQGVRGGRRLRHLEPTELGHQAVTEGQRGVGEPPRSGHHGAGIGWHRPRHRVHGGSHQLRHGKLRRARDRSGVRRRGDGARGRARVQLDPSCPRCLRRLGARVVVRGGSVPDHRDRSLGVGAPRRASRRLHRPSGLLDCRERPGTDTGGGGECVAQPRRLLRVAGVCRRGTGRESFLVGVGQPRRQVGVHRDRYLGVLWLVDHRRRAGTPRTRPPERAGHRVGTTDHLLLRRRRPSRRGSHQRWTTRALHPRRPRSARAGGSSRRLPTLRVGWDLGDAGHRRCRGVRVRQHLRRTWPDHDSTDRRWSSGPRQLPARGCDRRVRRRRHTRQHMDR